MAAQSIYTNEDIYKPQIWAMESLEIFRDNLGIRATVNVDFKNEIASKGDTINTRIPAVFTANDTDADGGVGSGNVQDPQATNIQISLDQNKEVTFGIRDLSDAKSLKSLRDEFMEPAIIAIVEAIEDHGISVMANATTGFGDTTDSNVIETVAGGTGNVPDTFQLLHIANAARLLDEDKIPNRLRYMVISPKQQEDLITDGGDISTALLMKSNEIGGDSALRERRIGRLQGFDIFMQQGIAQTAAADSGYPSSTYDRALFWYRNAVTYVTRPLPTPPTGAGAEVAVQSHDDQSIRVSVGYVILDKRLIISLDAVWGWKVIRHEAGGSIVTVNA